MTMLDALQASAKDLQLRAEEHLRLLDAAKEGGEGGAALAVCGDCRLWDCAHKRELKQILTEAIAVLENTRKAFKSRQLEDLRKKMIQALTETM